MTVGESARNVFRGQWPILVVGLFFLARLEGLEAHARAAEMRLGK